MRMPHGFVERYAYFLVFFTFWNALLVIFHRHTHRYVDLLYLSFVVMFMGSYFSFVRPGGVVYRFGGEAYFLRGLGVGDVVGHYVVFAYVLYLTFGPARLPIADALGAQQVLSALLLVAYGLLIDVKYVYGVGLAEVFAVFAAANVAFFAARFLYMRIA